MELKELFTSYCEKLDKEYCDHDYRYGYSKHVVMPLDIQETIGRMLFSYKKDAEYYGIKAGDYKTVQCFRLYFLDDYSRFYVSFYLPLKQNWEEYIFEVKGDKLVCLKYPTHFEDRGTPDMDVITDCIVKTIEMHLQK